MGNVGIALPGTAESSPFYNPSGLNDLTEVRYQFLSPTIELSSGSLGTIGDIKELNDNLKEADLVSERADIFDEYVQDRLGAFQRARFALDIFSYSRPNLAAGVILDERIYRSFRNQAFVNFEMQNLGDLITYVSGAYGFWENLLQVGVTLRPTFRFGINEADEVITFQDVVTENPDGEPVYTDQLSEITSPRFGFGADLGIKSNLSFPGLKDLSAYEYLKPEAGFVWHDIGSPSFGAVHGNTQTIGAGLAVHPDIWRLKNTVSVDFTELNLDRRFLTKFHFGIESKLPWFVTLRAGISQGYPTGGVSVDIWKFTFDAAIYAEEIGIQSREDGDVRVALALSFGL